MYFVKTPLLLKKIFPGCIWDIPTREKILYLTFDDGPHPVATPFVLDELKKYNAKATFFCIGKNVQLHPDIYKRILTEGHRTGNHSFNHLNGWKVDDDKYIADILEAGKFIDSNIFRPPYGRITKFQTRLLTSPNNKQMFKVIMWNILSADFDATISAEKASTNVIKSAKEGSIVVFHDSEKAFSKLQFALPKVLDHFSKKGYKFQEIRI